MNCIAIEEYYGAHNYLPVPVILKKGQGAYVWDEDGKRYLDMMSAYSAMSHGHCHPRLIKALTEQASQLAVVSRAFYTDKLGPFLRRACELTGQDKALPMNSGAEAVETAIKAARKWAYTVKAIQENQAEIIICEGNFHGRTTTIVSMSSEPQYRFGYGPYTPGFIRIPYGDVTALEKAITDNTAAFLVEPIQGEAGIRIPPDGYLKQCEEICRQHNVLLICDEVQTGLGRTGKLLACEHEGVKPDGLMLGKALGGGLLPVSLFLSKAEVMNVFTPGDHGSTFGGNPLAAAVGLAAFDVLIDEQLIQRSATLGQYMLQQLQTIQSPLIKEVRGRGLFMGIEIDKEYGSAHNLCLKLMKLGLLTKETHETVIRLAPPLVITQEQIDEAISLIRKVLESESRS
jgi:ornithine--oxo-acid transaminase